MQHTTVTPKIFLTYFYEVVIFEYWNRYKAGIRVPYSLLAKAFEAAVDISQEYGHLLNNSCDSYILRANLYHSQGLRDNFLRYLSLKILPCTAVEEEIRLYDSDQSDGPTFREQAVVERNYCGYQLTPKRCDPP